MIGSTLALLAAVAVLPSLVAAQNTVGQTVSSWFANLPWWGWLIIAIGILLVLVVLYFFIKKCCCCCCRRKKNKKGKVLQNAPPTYAHQPQPEYPVITLGATAGTLPAHAPSPQTPVYMTQTVTTTTAASPAPETTGETPVARMDENGNYIPDPIYDNVPVFDRTQAGMHEQQRAAAPQQPPMQPYAYAPQNAYAPQQPVYGAGFYAPPYPTSSTMPQAEQPQYYPQYQPENPRAMQSPDIYTDMSAAPYGGDIETHTVQAAVAGGAAAFALQAPLGIGQTSPDIDSGRDTVTYSQMNNIIDGYDGQPMSPDDTLARENVMAHIPEVAEPVQAAPTESPAAQK